MKKITIIALFIFTLMLIQCNYAGNKSGIHYFLDMHDTLAVKSQKEDFTTLVYPYPREKVKGADRIDSLAGPGSAMRTPPEGTAPRNYIPYLYSASDFDTPARELKNPLKPTAQVLEQGQKLYNVYCAICHGQQGHGDGPVSPRFPAIPALAGSNSNVLNWEDGRFFHIITVGRARMYSYSAQLTPEERWAVIHYIRLLQKNSNK